MSDRCQCYKSVKEPHIQCPNRATRGVYCGNHQNCQRTTSTKLSIHRPTKTRQLRQLGEKPTRTKLKIYKPTGTKLKIERPIKQTSTCASHPRHLVQLAGPEGFIYFHIPETKQSLVLLADDHGRNYMCPPSKITCPGYFEVPDWIEELVKTSEVCIDLLVENPYILDPEDMPPTPKQMLSHYQSPLTAISEKFATCKGKTRQCYDGKLRYHYIDVRQYSIGSGTERDVTHTWPIELFRGSSDCFIPETYNETTYRQLLAYCLGIDELEPVFRQYFNEVRHKYGMRMIEIEAFINMNKHTVSLIYKEMEKMYIDKTKFIDTLMETTMMFSEQTYMGLLTIQQDAYLLARLFINFDPHKMSRGPRQCQYSPRIQHAIICTGTAHTAIYCFFLSRMFGVEPKILVMVSDENCITLPQPFDFFADTMGTS